MNESNDNKLFLLQYLVNQYNLVDKGRDSLKKLTSKAPMVLSVSRRMGEQAESPPTGVIVSGDFLIK